MSAELARLIDGFRVTQTIHCVELGVPDLLDDGERTADDLAEASGAEPVLTAAGVLDRCEIVAGSLFSSIPEGGDAYVLKSIIHDWEDEESVAILRSCREAMGPDAAALVIERDLGPPNENPLAKLSDLNMFVMPGGRERTLDEYAALLDRADLRLAAAHPTTSGHLVIEAGVQ